MTVENEQRLVEELRVAVEERDQARERSRELEDGVKSMTGSSRRGDDPDHVWVRFPQEEWDALRDTVLGDEEPHETGEAA